MEKLTLEQKAEKLARSLSAGKFEEDLEPQYVAYIIRKLLEALQKTISTETGNQ